MRHHFRQKDFLAHQSISMRPLNQYEGELIATVITVLAGLLWRWIERGNLIRKHEKEVEEAEKIVPPGYTKK